MSIPPQKRQNPSSATGYIILRVHTSFITRAHDIFSYNFGTNNINNNYASVVSRIYYNCEYYVVVVVKRFNNNNTRKINEKTSEGSTRVIYSYTIIYISIALPQPFNPMIKRDPSTRRSLLVEFPFGFFFFFF